MLDTVEDKLFEDLPLSIRLLFGFSGLPATIVDPIFRTII
jgi:hypothetical protein